MQRLRYNTRFIFLALPLIYLILMSNSQKSQEHIYVPWRKSKHARAYAALFKPEAKEIAELSGIDIEPFKSPICLGCHTTAYNEEEWERDPSFAFFFIVSRGMTS